MDSLFDMKRKVVLLMLPIASVLALVAVKYRLDHPPLTQADNMFRLMADCSDEVVIVDLSKPTVSNNPVASINYQPLAHLQGSQIQELEAKTRLTDMPWRSLPRTSTNDGIYGLRFYQHHKLTGGVDIIFLPFGAVMQAVKGKTPSPFDSLVAPRGRTLHTHFVRRFATYLARVAPFSNP